MKILVVGGSGLVGWDFVNRASDRGHNVTYTYLSSKPTNYSESAIQLDIRDQEAVGAVVCSADPDVVVHTAGITDVDACERNPEIAHEVNVEGTRSVVSACEKYGSGLTFISTGFVFDGKGETFSEEDIRSAPNYYGQTKIEAEDIVSDSDTDHLICRIDQPYCWPTTWQDDTFVKWVVDQLQNGKSFPIFVDWFNTPIFIPDCSKAILALLKRSCTGTYHVCGPDYVNRYDWAKIIARVLGYDPSLIRRGNSDEAGLPARRPNNHLSNNKVEKEINMNLKSIKDALDIMAKLDRR
jgi:dTDP-4-dehydrorhamnose reductase